MKGKITKVIAEKKFFFVDNDYFCHFDKYKDNPEVGDIVEYTQSERNEKKNAINVRLVQKRSSPLSEYFDSLEKGYFYSVNDKNYLKKEFIIDYPQKLAEEFSSGDKNKAAQIAKFYYNIKHIENLYKIHRDFNKTKTELLKLSPIATKAKDRNHITAEFEQFLIRNINISVISEENFIEGFVPHFQSIVCYY